MQLSRLPPSAIKFMTVGFREDEGCGEAVGVGTVSQHQDVLPKTSLGWAHDRNNGTLTYGSRGR